ncbi:MAG: hypothetical protein HKN17_05910 [Rhodothermales bacterium]|nr:hypothetical protein [Rhodothermales bacterium]
MTDRIIQHIAEVAERWTDPEYDVRVDAVEETLEADNSFTEASVTVAINRCMHHLTPDALAGWSDRLRSAAEGAGDRTVGVLNPGNIPLVEVQDFAAVLLAGFSYAGTVSSRSPALFPAFVEDLRREDPGLPAHIGGLDDVLTGVDALIASGTDETMGMVAERARAAGLPDASLWLRGHRFGVAVLDGRESEEERAALAEDVLLHEGAGCRSVAIVWAPSGTSPDPWLESFAEFRAAVPAPDSTTGRLKMQQAFLAAVDTPHAWAEDFQFLVSRGDPEPQGPAHLRWCEYESIDEAKNWITRHRESIQEVYVTERLGRSFPDASRPGDAQHPPLDWCPDQLCHADFFSRIC